MTMENRDTGMTRTNYRTGRILTAVLMLLPVVAVFWSPAPLALSLVLFANLHVLALIDWYSFRLPNLLNLTLLLTGFAQALYLSADIWRNLIGVIVGFAVIYLINAGYRRLRGQDGLGMGDAKLLAAGGAWITWSGLPPALLVASLAGLASVMLAQLSGRRITAQDRIAFGPFLCLGIWISWLFFKPLTG